jgi:hypothetical protein
MVLRPDAKGVQRPPFYLTRPPRLRRTGRIFAFFQDSAGIFCVYWNGKMISSERKDCSMLDFFWWFPPFLA